MGALLTERGNSGRGDAGASADRAAPARAALKQIWQSGEVSAHDLADEAALAHALPRLQLPDLLAAQAAVARFTPRFLRDKFVFPFVDASGAPHLAVGDPADAAPLRAAEIEFGGAVSLAVASFEDIATALSLTIKEAATGPDAAAGPAARLEDNIDSLRDLASGAPVVRAFDELLERALDLRASDVHIEPTRDGLAVRMRVDGLLRVVAAPTQIPPQALISRIKIVSGLNIAERRLPQDGASRPCRRSMARPPSSVCWRATGAFWKSPNWVSRLRMSARCGAPSTFPTA